MKEKVIEYWQNRAEECLKDAELLLKHGSLYSTVNRIYYAMFYQVSALLLAKNLSFSKHSGVLSAFNKEFVKTGKVDKELGRFFNRMFEYRKVGDYGDLVEFNQESVEEWLERAKEFLDVIKKLMFKTIKEDKNESSES